MNDMISREKLSVDVENKIVEQIRSGRWAVGMRLPSEAGLAELFLVSRSTVRAALKSLQHLGVLQTKSGSGTYVAESALAALEGRELAAVLKGRSGVCQLVQARYVLEPQLAALAAQNATAVELQELFSILSQMQPSDDRHTLIANGYLFHQKVAQLAHNGVLLDFYQSIAMELRGLRVLDSLTLETFLEGIEEHRAIAVAISRRDDPLAKQLMRSHLKKDYGDYLKAPEILE